MIKIDRLEKRTDELARELDHRAKLMRALEPDPPEYEYTGEEPIDGGANAHCSCGHEIRWIFTVIRKRDGKIMPIGSTCINHFAAINPITFQRLNQAYDILLKKLSEAEKSAKAAAAQVKVEAAKIKFLAAYDRASTLYDNYRSRGEHAPYELWMLMASRKYSISPDGVPEYTRACDYIKWYDQQADCLLHAITQPET